MTALDIGILVLKLSCYFLLSEHFAFTECKVTINYINRGEYNSLRHSCYTLHLFFINVADYCDVFVPQQVKQLYRDVLLQ